MAILNPVPGGNIMWSPLPYVYQAGNNNGAQEMHSVSCLLQHGPVT